MFCRLWLSISVGAALVTSAAAQTWTAECTDKQVRFEQVQNSAKMGTLHIKTTGGPFSNVLAAPMKQHSVDPRAMELCSHAVGLDTPGGPYSVICMNAKDKTIFAKGKKQGEPALYYAGLICKGTVTVK